MSFRSHRSAVHPYPPNPHGHGGHGASASKSPHLGSAASRPHSHSHHSHSAMMTPRQPFVEIAQPTTTSAPSAKSLSQAHLHRSASRSTATATMTSASASASASGTTSRQNAHLAPVVVAPGLGGSAAAKKSNGSNKMPFRDMHFFFAEEKDGDESQVTALGGTIHVFFSKRVTHLIVPDAIKAQLPAFLASGSASTPAAPSATTPAASATHSATSQLLKGRPNPHHKAPAAPPTQARSATMAKLVQDAISFGAEVWGVGELRQQLRLHTARHPSNTPANPNSHSHARAHSGHPQAHAPGGSRATHSNHHHPGGGGATTTAGYVQVPNTNYRVRPLQEPYLVVLDKQGHHRPCILKEYTDPSDLPRLHRTPHESILSPFQRSLQHAPPLDMSLPGNGVVRAAPAKPNPSLAYLAGDPGQPPTEWQLQSKLAQEGARVSAKAFEESHLHADLDALKRSAGVVRAVLPFAAPRASYCEWCGVRYDNMVEHMASSTHQQAIRQPGAWRELDAMIRTYGRKYVDPPALGSVGKRMAAAAGTAAGKANDEADVPMLSSQPDVVLDLGFVFDDDDEGEQNVMSEYNDEQVPLEPLVARPVMPPAYEQDTQVLGASGHVKEDEEQEDGHESPLAVRKTHNHHTLQRSRRLPASKKACVVTQPVFEWDDQGSDDVFGDGGKLATVQAPPQATTTDKAKASNGKQSQATPSTTLSQRSASNSSAAASLLRSHSQSQLQPQPSLSQSRLVFDVDDSSDVLDPANDPIVPAQHAIRASSSSSRPLLVGGHAPGPRPSTATPITVPQTMPPPSTLASTTSMSSRRSVSGNGGGGGGGGGGGFASAARTPAHTGVGPAGSGYSNWYPSTGYFTLNASGLTPATSVTSWSLSTSSATMAHNVYRYTPTPMPPVTTVQPPSSATMGSAAPAALWEYDPLPAAATARQPPVGTSRRSAPSALSMSLTAHAGHTPGPPRQRPMPAEAGLAAVHMPASPDVLSSFFKGGACPAPVARADERGETGGGGEHDDRGTGAAQEVQSSELLSLNLSMSMSCGADGESAGEGSTASVSESMLGDSVLKSAADPVGGVESRDMPDVPGSFKSPLRSVDMHMFRSETSTSGGHYMFGDYFDDEEDDERKDIGFKHAVPCGARDEQAGSATMTTTTDENVDPGQPDYVHAPSPLSVHSASDETQTDEDVLQVAPGDQAAAGGNVGASEGENGSSPCRTAAKRVAKRRRGHVLSSTSVPPQPQRTGSLGKPRILATSAAVGGAGGAGNTVMHWAAATPSNATKSNATTAAAAKAGKSITYPTPAISGSTHEFVVSDVASTGEGRDGASSDLHVFDFDHGSMDDDGDEDDLRGQEPAHKRQRLGSSRARRGSVATPHEAGPTPPTVLATKHGAGANGLTRVITSPSSVTTRARARAERESAKDSSDTVSAVTTAVGMTTRHKLKQQQQQPLSVSKAVKSLPTPLTR